MSSPNPRSAELNPKARNFLDRHIRNTSGQNNRDTRRSAEIRPG